MFHSLRLIEAFEHLTTVDEWHWFGPMVARGNMHFGVDGWPLYSLNDRLAYDLLWQDLVERAHTKLRTGDWLAKGISAKFGPQALPIDQYLWDYLRIVHRGEVAEGDGFRFLALTVSELQPAEVRTPFIEQPILRRQLTEWIRSDAERPGAPPLREKQLAAAREAFPGVNITNNMFLECRRSAGLGQSRVQRGRPKAKGSGD